MPQTLQAPTQVNPAAQELPKPAAALLSPLPVPEADNIEVTRLLRSVAAGAAHDMAGLLLMIESDLDFVASEWLAPESLGLHPFDADRDFISPRADTRTAIVNGGNGAARSRRPDAAGCLVAGHGGTAARLAPRRRRRASRYPPGPAARPHQGPTPDADGPQPCRERGPFSRRVSARERPARRGSAGERQECRDPDLSAAHPRWTSRQHRRHRQRSGHEPGGAGACLRRPSFTTSVPATAGAGSGSQWSSDWRVPPAVLFVSPPQ